jgi:thiol-disulfide isomerase/thioredoxin
MSLLNRNFLIGAGAGVALTLVTLQIWTHYLEQSLVSAAQPVLLRPFMQAQPAKAPKSSDHLPRPWLPKTANRVHDNWEVRALDGKTVSLAELRGKVVFLNFWSADCAPCREQLPGIERLYSSLGNESVAFLIVTKDDDNRARDFLKENNLDIPVYFAAKDLPRDFPDGGIPVTVILDSSGAIVFRNMGPVNWDDDKAREYIRGLELQGSLPE